MNRFLPTAIALVVACILQIALAPYLAIFGVVPKNLFIVVVTVALTEGSEQRAPMGQAVIGGVITSSLLTLVVVPVIYCWLDDLGAWVTRKLFGAAAAPAVASADPASAALPK